MSNRHDSSAPGRRQFLRLAAVTGGTLAVVGATQGALVLDAETDEPRVNCQTKGYRVTSHIEEYYNKART